MRWHGVLQERCRSCLSTAEFCRQRGLALWQFYYWHGRLAGPRPTGGTEDAESEAARLAPVMLPSASAGDDGPLFAPVVLPSAGTGLRLRLGELELEIAPDFDEATLKRLLRAMGGSC